MAWKRLRRIAWGLILVVSLLGASAARAATLKLFLKDGTYELVSSYEVKGDRVRYYSVERSEWEEVPKSLVDFEATRKAQEEEKASQQKQLEEARELEKERFEKPENSGYEVAPGLRLPQEEGIYSVDGLRVIRMPQSSAEVVTDKKRAALVMALPGPLVKSRSLVVLQGTKAAIRLAQFLPVFYVQSAEGLGARLELIQVKPEKETRLVEMVEVRGKMGKPAAGANPTELRTTVPLERTQLAPGLYKLQPTHPLEPGEYALGELDQEKLNLELWDFGVGASPGK
jgi:hypothetical protein